MSPPELSVIVTTHDRRELLRACLASFGRQTAPPEAFELVVVVDGSNDGTEEMLEQIDYPFGVSVVAQPQRGQSAARNAGAGRARGRILLFVDDDEEAGETLVAAHVRAHRGHRKLVGVGLVRRHVPPGADRLARMRAEDAEDYDARIRSRPPTYADCYGGNLSVPRELHDEVGGHPIGLRRLDDFEFAYRLNQAGAAFEFVPDAVVTECRTHGWTELIAGRELVGRVSVELYGRHPAMIEQLELGGSGFWARQWSAPRMLAFVFGLSPRSVARLGFLLPRDRWARLWLRFAWNYAYWHGVRAAADRELWRKLKSGVLILRYHAFATETERPSRYVVAARRFARQLALLKRLRYEVISLSQYVDYRRRHMFPPARSVVITIDDGYEDVDTVARPILKRLGVRATVFLVSSPEGHHPGGPDANLRERPLLDLARARQMLGGPIEFGAHTRTHRDLTTLDNQSVREEVQHSKLELERALGVPVHSFAYPFGAVSQGIRDAAQQAGFWSACGIRSGRNRPGTDLFDLRRVEIRGSDARLAFVATLLLGDIRNLRVRLLRNRGR